VGASDRNDAIASFELKGTQPGRHRKAGHHQHGRRLMAAKAGGTSTSGYYKAMSGTSMATPMTSGVVALVLQANKTLTPAQVKTVLQKTAKQPGSSVPNNDYGYGRVDAKAALEYVLTGKVPVPRPRRPDRPGAEPDRPLLLRSRERARQYR